jgi:hypothetical protein
MRSRLNVCNEFSISAQEEEVFIHYHPALEYLNIHAILQNAPSNSSESHATTAQGNKW